MEVYFSSVAEQDTALYILSHYPRVAVGMVGSNESLKYALEKQGNKVYMYDEKGMDERARFLIAIGGSEEVDIAKKLSLPYIVLSRDVPLSSMQKIGINDFQIMEYSYPNAVFIDTCKNYFHIQAELTTLALGVMLEAVGIVGTGLRNERAKSAYNGVIKIKKLLASFVGYEEMFDTIKETLALIGGAPFVAMVDKFAFLRCGDNLTHARFYSIFSLLYSIRLFTKCDFCAILPYMDLVRVRMLCEEMGLEISTSTVVAKDLTYNFSLIDELVPTKGELKGYLDRFWLEGDRVNLDFELLLTNILLASCKVPKTSMLVKLVECGYIDALIDSR